jgi:hypothetical protein
MQTGDVGWGAKDLSKTQKLLQKLSDGKRSLKGRWPEGWIILREIGANMVMLLLATATLWAGINTFPKLKKWGTLQRSGPQTLLPAKKMNHKDFYLVVYRFYVIC